MDVSAAQDPLVTILPRAVRDLLARGTADAPPFRAAPLHVTLRAAAEMAPAAGITRIADLTGLDRLDLPVVSVTRPNARSLGVASGKGLTLLDACASGLMEALELFHAETFEAAFPLQALGSDVLLPDLARLPQHKDRAPVTSWDLVHRVARGFELNSGRQTALPFDLAHADFRPGPAADALFPIGSNGLAGGNSRSEAVLHALFELVERDAVAMLAAGGGDPLTGRRLLDWSSVTDPLLRAMHARLRGRGLEVYAHDATTALGIPAFYCRLVQSDGGAGGLAIATDGSGCHLDPAIALRRALTEAAQTRLLLISGARDDIRARNYRTRPSRPPATEPQPFAWPAYTGPREIEPVLQRMRALLGAGGHRQVIVVPLGGSDALSFVRVLVPGLRDDQPCEAGT